MGVACKQTKIAWAVIKGAAKQSRINVLTGCTITDMIGIDISMIEGSGYSYQAIRTVYDHVARQLAQAIT